MRAVVQRVQSARVEVVTGETTREAARISTGLVVLLGVRNGDTMDDVAWIADKIANLRVFEDESGTLNRSALEIGAEIMLVSNFTLYGDCRKGRRPSFADAASGDVAEPLYDAVGNTLETLGIRVGRGEFGAEMRVSLVNDGPVTLLIDSRRTF